MAIVAIGVALRAYGLSHQSLWVDEVLTAAYSTGSVSQVLFRTEGNIPPLYYFVVNTALRLGDGEAVLRLPSLIFGVLSILLLFLVVRLWLGRTIGLLSAAVMAVSPFHVWYSQEARPYALLLFLSLLSLWCLQRSTADAAHPRWKVGFVASAAALVYTHPVGIAFLGVAAAYVLLAVPGPGRRAWLPAFGAIGLLIAPALYHAVTLAPTRSANPNYSFNPVHTVYAIWTFATGYSLGPSLTELHGPDRKSVALRYALLIGPVLALVGALVVLGVRELARRHGRVLAALALWFVIPMAFAVLGALVTEHPFNVRYAILSYPPFVVLLTVGGYAIRSRPLRSGAWASLFLVSALSLAGYYFVDRYHREDNRAAARFLAAHASPDDLVLVNAPYTRRSLQHYYGGRDARVVSYPAEARFVDPTKLANDLGPMLAPERRVWLFLSRTYHSDPAGHLRAYFDKRFRRDTVFTANGVQLIRYARDSALADPAAQISLPRRMPDGASPAGTPLHRD